jgi:hypothetical protein
VTAVGYRFTLILSREITDDESTVLREADAVCSGAIFGPDTLPTNADVPVTKMDIDDTSAPTLADSIQAAMDAVKKIPDLSIPGLTVPAQPAGPLGEDKTVVEGEKPETVSEERIETEDKKPAKRPAAKKPAAKRTAAKKEPEPETVPASVGSA